MSDKKKIVDARRGPDGNISHVLFEGNEKFTSKERAIPMAEQGRIENAHVVDRGDDKHLRTNPDSKTKNNLGEMADN
jgi:hypothetical protein